MAKLTPTIDVRFSDELAERVRRNFSDQIRELQNAPALTSEFLRGVSLPAGATTLIAHRLGRPPVMITLSPIQGSSTPGVIEEVLSTSVDRTKFIQLRASGYGATITVDVELK